MQLLVLETGGTINGILDPHAPPPLASRVVAWLRQHAERLALELSAETVVMKDSRAITDADRDKLAAEIEASPAEHVLIPHGTYTMPDTGVYLRQHLSRAAQNRTIVLVGSLVPLGEPDSDAPAALEFALQTLRSHSPGVWLVMSRRVWHPAQVMKDVVSGEYRPRDDEPGELPCAT